MAESIEATGPEVSLRYLINEEMNALPFCVSFSSAVMRRLFAASHLIV